MYKYFMTQNIDDTLRNENSLDHRVYDGSDETMWHHPHHLDDMHLQVQYKILWLKVLVQMNKFAAPESHEKAQMNTVLDDHEPSRTFLSPQSVRD